MKKLILLFSVYITYRKKANYNLPEQAKCRSNGTIKSSWSGNFFPVPADGRFPGSRHSAWSPSRLFSGCVSAWPCPSAYSDEIAQASHLFPFYPLSAQSDCRGTGCFSLFNWRYYMTACINCQCIHQSDPVFIYGPFCIDAVKRAQRQNDTVNYRWIQKITRFSL